MRRSADTRCYYCDVRQSQQKGRLRGNHVEVRKILPKGRGVSFDRLTGPRLRRADVPALRAQAGAGRHVRYRHAAGRPRRRWAGAPRRAGDEKVPFDRLNATLGRSRPPAANAAGPTSTPGRPQPSGDPKSTPGPANHAQNQPSRCDSYRTHRPGKRRTGAHAPDPWRENLFAPQVSANNENTAETPIDTFF